MRGQSSAKVVGAPPRLRTRGKRAVTRIVDCRLLGFVAAGLPRHFVALNFSSARADLKVGATPAVAGQGGPRFAGRGHPAEGIAPTPARSIHSRTAFLPREFIILPTKTADNDMGECGPRGSERGHPARLRDGDSPAFALLCLGCRQRARRSSSEDVRASQRSSAALGRLAARTLHGRLQQPELCAL